MDFTIYSIGDSAFLIQILNALAMITAHNDFFGALRVAMLLGVLAAVLTGLMKSGRELPFPQLLICFLIVWILFVPKARVLVEDTYTGAVMNVDNVPLGVVATGAIISNLGYGLTQLMETAYTYPTDVTHRGFADSLKIVLDIRKAAQNDYVWQAINQENGGNGVDVKTSWINYVKDCTFSKIDYEDASPSTLYSDPFLQAIQWNSSLIYTKVYLGPPLGATMTCTDAFTALSNTLNISASTASVSDQALLSIARRPPAEIANGQTGSLLTTTLQSLTNSSIASQDYIHAALLFPILYHAADEGYKSFLDLSGSMMVNEAISQRNTQWATEQTLFMSIVRPMMTFFEAFVYAITPMMALIILLGEKGLNLAGKYVMLIFWIQLWLPILSIINLYINMAAAGEMQALQDSGGTLDFANFSFYQLNQLNERVQTWVATGGLLAASTPALSMMLLYGTSVAATSLAGRLNGSDAINEKHVAPSISNTPNVANMQARYTGDQVAGLHTTGTEIAIGKGNLSSNWSSLTGSTESFNREAQVRYSDDLSNAVLSGNGHSINLKNAQTLGSSLSHSQNSIDQLTWATGHALAKSWNSSSETGDFLSGVMGAAIRSPNSSSIDSLRSDPTMMNQIPDSAKREEFINRLGDIQKMTKGDPVAYRNAVNELAKDVKNDNVMPWNYLLKDMPGSNKKEKLANALEKLGNGAKSAARISPMGMVGGMIADMASIGVTGNQTDSTGHSSGFRNDILNKMDLSKMEQEGIGLSTSLASTHSAMKDEGVSFAWAKESRASLGRSLSEVSAASRSFRTSSDMAQAMQNTAGADWNNIAGTLLSMPQGQSFLRQIEQLDKPIRDAIRQDENMLRNTSMQGASEQQVRATAALRTLTHPNTYIMKDEGQQDNPQSVARYQPLVAERGLSLVSAALKPFGSSNTINPVENRDELVPTQTVRNDLNAAGNLHNIDLTRPTHAPNYNPAPVTLNSAGEGSNGSVVKAAHSAAESNQVQLQNQAASVVAANELPNAEARLASAPEIPTIAKVNAGLNKVGDMAGQFFDVTVGGRTTGEIHTANLAEFTANARSVGLSESMSQLYASTKAGDDQMATQAEMGVRQDLKSRGVSEAGITNVIDRIQSGAFVAEGRYSEALQPVGRFWAEVQPIIPAHQSSADDAPLELKTASEVKALREAAN